MGKGSKPFFSRSPTKKMAVKVVATTSRTPSEAMMNEEYPSLCTILLTAYSPTKLATRLIEASQMALFHRSLPPTAYCTAAWEDEKSTREEEIGALANLCC